MKNKNIESQSVLKNTAFCIFLVAYAFSSSAMLISLNVIDGLSWHIGGSWVAFLSDTIKVGVFVATLIALIFKKEFRNWHFVFIFTLIMFMFSVTETVAYT